MSDLELQKGNTKVRKQGDRSLYLFEITRYKLNSDLENLISFSVILYNLRVGKYLPLNTSTSGDNCYSICQISE